MTESVAITETVLRDAHQCLIATRMRTEHMLPICEKLDAVGYWALESWGGATFDACLRFLKEDPWQRLQQLKQAMPNTPLSMLVRGQNLVGYRHYPDDVVTAFIHKAAVHGIDVFRVFDALNDLRNTETTIAAVKAAGKHAQGAICYTVSPVHTVDQFVALAKRYVELGCDSIAIKDMAGLLTPVMTAQLHQQMRKAVSVPIHTHSHMTAGLSAMCMQAAIENGCRVIDTAISSFAEGASHPCTESMVVALQGTPYDTDYDLTLLNEIGEYFKDVRKLYHQFESDSTGLDPRVSIYQVPGGMISNLYNQLKQQNALDKIPEVHEEIPRVRKDLGYPPLVTPTSQIVGTQAVLNVITGERYKTITNEVKLYCQGKYGKPPAEINPEVRKKAIGNADVITSRPADLLDAELDLMKKRSAEFARSEEDVLSYCVFPDITEEYCRQRNDNALRPEVLEPVGVVSDSNSQSAPKVFKVSYHGEQYDVNITGTGHRGEKERYVYLTIDGVPEEMLVDLVELRSEAIPSNSTRPPASEPGHVTVSMPSTIVDVKVKPGDEVAAGDVVLITEAMKMETEIQAPISGIVDDMFVIKGDTVTPDEALLSIRARAPASDHS